MPCPAAYRLPPDISLGDFLTQMFCPDHKHHPEYSKIDYTTLVWTLDGQPWAPVLDKSLRENGVTHMSYLSFRAPGLDGLNGDGV